MTSSIKPEVHIISQRHRRGTEPRTDNMCTENLAKIGHVVQEICTSADRQTDRHGHHKTPLPYRGRSIEQGASYAASLRIAMRPTKFVDGLEWFELYKQRQFYHRRRLPQGNGGDCPRRKLLIGRRPVRNWTRRTISSLFLCRKLHLFLGKSTKAAATRDALFAANMHQFVCRLAICPRPHALAELTALPRPSSCI